jgi:hypothetical protein
LYVSKRGGVYQFRKAIPQDLSAFFGSPTIRLSLRTAVSSVARGRAARMLVEVDTLFEILRQERPIGDAREIVFDLLQQPIATGTGMIPEQRVHQLQKAMDRLTAAESKRNQPPKNSSSMIAWRVWPTGSRQPSTPPFETRTRCASPTRRFQQHSKTTRKSSRSTFRVSTATTCRGRLDFFAGCIDGDPAVRDMVQADVVKYRDLLDQLPARFQSRFPGFAGSGNYRPQQQAAGAFSVVGRGCHRPEISGSRPQFFLSTSPSPHVDKRFRRRLFCVSANSALGQVLAGHPPS